MMVQNGSKLIYILTTMCTAIASGLFIAERNSSFKHTYTTLTVRSATECCLHCKHEDSCNSVNFCPIDKTCELSNRSPADFPYSDVIASPNKNLFFVSTYPCPAPWILYHRHCYRLVTWQQTWKQSEDNCNDMGAYLTDVLDGFENTFVNQIGNDALLREFWIGLGNDYHTAKPQLWTSGQHISYTNFLPGEPNNSGGTEGCIMTASHVGGTWNDLTCSFHLSSVCKKRHY